jgi:hypothetical protein
VWSPWLGSARIPFCGIRARKIVLMSRRSILRIPTCEDSALRCYLIVTVTGNMIFKLILLESSRESQHEGISAKLSGDMES